jgi:hypothetical protein
MNAAGCPDPKRLLSRALGELSEHDARAVTRHLSECAACRQESEGIAELLGALGQPAAGIDAREDFVVEAVARARRDGTPPGLKQARGFRWARLAAAAGLLVLVGVAGTRLGRVHRNPGEFQARGGPAAAQARFGAEIVALNGGKLWPLAGRVLGKQDGLTARYWNLSGDPAYLTAFALDQAGAVHWLFPAWLDEHTNPTSIRVAPHSPIETSSEVVSPAAPAPGTLRVVAVMTTEPLSVREVERRLAGKSARDSVGQIFEKADVREWLVTWEGR